MIRRELPKPVEIQRVVLIVLGLAAAGGWCAYGLASSSAGQVEAQLTGQVAALQESHARLLADHTRLENTVQDWREVQTRLPAVREELRQLAEARDQAEAELVLAQMGLADQAGGDAASGSDVSATGSVGGKGAGSKQVAASAQAALSKLGYGKITVDGVVGPGTRRAIEAFQKDRGLNVTSELDAPTLRKIVAAVKG